MHIISHRGNLNGMCPDLENSPDYIKQAAEAGFEVEVDVWFVDGRFMLGHDGPHHTVDISFLKSLPLWCHAKNADALEKLLEAEVHCFWHESDTYTITSRGAIWCYIGKRHQRGITVFLGEPTDSQYSLYGVCTDHPLKWRERRHT